MVRLLRSPGLLCETANAYTLIPMNAQVCLLTLLSAMHIANGALRIRKLCLAYGFVAVEWILWTKKMIRLFISWVPLFVKETESARQQILTARVRK